MVEVCGRLGIDARASTRHGERLRRRGFRAVEEHALPCPLGPWARGQRQKRLGWMARKDLYEGSKLLDQHKKQVCAASDTFDLILRGDSS